jgi:hypothetical protein
MHAALTAKRTSRSTKPRAKEIRLKEPFSVDEPRYLLGQVAAAAGITAHHLKTWIARKVIVLGEHDRDAHGKGSSRVFTLRRALVVATTVEFVGLGMATSLAGPHAKNEIDIALRDAKGDPLRVELVTVIYPLKEFRRFIASPITTVGELLKNPSLDAVVDSLGDEAPAAFMLFNRKALVERVLRRLGELDDPTDTKGT